MIKHTLSYAQNREDVIIDAFFGAKPSGFYVDVGANHPTKDSVTKLFYKKGWRGINIEPNEYLLSLLQADRPEDINVGKGAGAKETEVVFRDFKNADGLSTFSDEMKSQNDIYYAPFKQDFVDTKLQVTTLKKIFDEYDVKFIDFMKVDVEGYEYEVLAGNDWKKYKPELICIEANHILKDWRPILTANGYINFFNDGLNDYYALKSSRHLGNFSFPEKVFMTYPLIVPFVSHSDQSDVDESEFLEKGMVRPERPSIKIKIKWSLLGLAEALHEGFIVAIIYQKRRMLDTRIKKNLYSVSGGSNYMSIRKPYYGYKLFLLRVGNLSLTILERIAGKALRLAQ